MFSIWRRLPDAQLLSSSRRLGGVPADARGMDGRCSVNDQVTLLLDGDEAGSNVKAECDAWVVGFARSHSIA